MDKLGLPLIEVLLNCIGCIHKPGGTCNLTGRVPEHRCHHYEEVGRYYKTQKGTVKDVK